MWRDFFLIPRKYLDFFFLCECLEASFRRPENIIIIAIITNHEYCHIPPSHPFLLQELSPVHSASLTPGNHFSIVLKLWNLTFATTCLFCALWLFSVFAASCLGRICRPELSRTSLQQTPACRAHPANQPLSHGAVCDRQALPDTVAMISDIHAHSCPSYSSAGNYCQPTGMRERSMCLYLSHLHSHCLPV